MMYGNLLLAALGLFVWQPPWPGARDMLLLAFAGIFQMGLSYYLFCLSSRGVTALEMTLVPVLEPVLNPIWVYMGIGEKPGAWALVGGCVVLSGITAWSVLKSRKH
jgi:drug/metabolite transporter (DMT)-like permease